MYFLEMIPALPCKGTWLPSSTTVRVRHSIGEGFGHASDKIVVPFPKIARKLLGALHPCELRCEFDSTFLFKGRLCYWPSTMGGTDLMFLQCVNDEGTGWKAATFSADCVHCVPCPDEFAVIVDDMTDCLYLVYKQAAVFIDKGVVVAGGSSP